MDKIIKGLAKQETQIEMQFVKEGKQIKLYLAHNGSSGCKYNVNNAEDVAEAVKDYLLYCGDN